MRDEGWPVPTDRRERDDVKLRETFQCSLLARDQ
jgi:hypothetical protein